MNNEIYMAGPSVTQADEEIVLDALRNGWYGKNAYKYVELFEAEFAKYHNRAHALMTPNCTSAIHLLLKGLNIHEGDEIIVPECTWIATAAPIHYQRAKIVFADIDPINWCLTPETIEARITSKTKAVIVVDLYGNMPDMDAIKAVCDKHGIYLIEDAAEALGSKYKDVKAGKFGVGSVFSFHRTKTLTTGEGGMLLIDDEQLYQRCKFLRDHGRKPGSYYNTEITGMKKANTDALDELIPYLKRNGYTMIARIPAFADTNYAASHPELALCVEGETEPELWVDDNENNWLSPEKPIVLSYQEQICKELSSLGFQEVVFNDFYFPTSGTIIYTSNLTRSELIASAARELQSAFTGSNLTISFCTTDTGFPVDASSGRLYVPDVSGANVDKIIASLSNTVNNLNTQVVFLSDSRDTRFDAYGTLRPLLYEGSVDIALPEE